MAKRQRPDFNKDKATEGYGGGTNRKWFIVPDEELAKLGIGEWRSVEDPSGGDASHYIKPLDPHPDDGPVLGLSLYFHSDIGVNGDSYLCPILMGKVFTELGIPLPEGWDGRCPVCEAHEANFKTINRLQDNNGSKEDIDAAWGIEKELRAFAGRLKDRHPKRKLIWMNDASNNKFDLEKPDPRFFVMPWSVWVGLRDLLTDDRTGKELDPSNPDPDGGGRVFGFVRSGKGRDTEYRKFGMYDHEPLSEEWDNLVPSFADILTFATYDEIADAMGTGRKASEPDGSRERTIGEDIADVYKNGMDDSPRRGRRQEAEDKPEAEEPRRRGRRSEADEFLDGKKEDTEKEDRPRGRSRSTERSTEPEPEPDTEAAEVSEGVQRVRQRRAARNNDE